MQVSIAEFAPVTIRHIHASKQLKQVPIVIAEYYNRNYVEIVLATIAELARNVINLSSSIEFVQMTVDYVER